MARDIITKQLKNIPWREQEENGDHLPWSLWCL